MTALVGRAVSDRLLKLAVVAESWPAAPRLAQLTDLACELDGVRRSLARLLGEQAPGTPAQCAAQCVRQLHACAQAWPRCPPDSPAIEAATRLALNLLAALTALDTEKDSTQ